MPLLGDGALGLTGIRWRLCCSWCKKRATEGFLLSLLRGGDLSVPVLKGSDGAGSSTVMERQSFLLKGPQRAGP